MQVQSKAAESLKRPSSELSRQKRSGSIKRDSVVTIQEDKEAKEAKVSATGSAPAPAPAPEPIEEDAVPPEGSEAQGSIPREASVKSAVLMQPSEQHRESVR